MSFAGYAGVSLECSIAVIAVLTLSALFKDKLHAGILRLIWLVIALRLSIPLRATLFVYGRNDASPRVLNVGNELSSIAPVGRMTTAIWLFGAAIFFVFHLVCYLSVCRKIGGEPVRAESLPLEDAIREKLLASGLRLVRADVASPMLTGFFGRRLVLPEGVYSDRELNLVVAHELCHHQSHDVALKLLLLIANALNWFNPVIYWMARRADGDLESACDARVLRDRPTDEQKAYAGAILHTVEGARNILSSRFSSSGKELHSRMTRILHGRARLQGSVPLLLAVIGILTHSAVSVCARAPAVAVSEARQAEEWEPEGGKEKDSKAAAPQEAPRVETPVLPVSPDETIELRTPENGGGDPVEILTVADARVSAPISGEVVRAGYNPHGSGGLEVEIAGETGRAVLRHLGEIGVERGDAVEQGAVIGKAGRTGAAAQEMCSFEWKPKGA